MAGTKGHQSKMPKCEICMCPEHWVDKDGALLDIKDVATAPSKDFYQIFVTPEVVVLRIWKIVPPTRQDVGNSPVEMVTRIPEFQYDERMHSEIQRVGGTNLLNYITEFCKGHVDYLPRLHEMDDKILEKIILNLDLEDISAMSRVNKMFRNLCNGDDLWQKIYQMHSETPITDELQMLAEKSGWKRLFFTNKLQLQMQLRRMRNPPTGQYAFLTSQEEEMDTGVQHHHV